MKYFSLSSGRSYATEPDPLVTRQDISAVVRVGQNHVRLGYSSQPFLILRFAVNGVHEHPAKKRSQRGILNECIRPRIPSRNNYLRLELEDGFLKRSGAKGRLRWIKSTLRIISTTGGDEKGGPGNPSPPCVVGITVTSDFRHLVTG
jgi:hypothetical protein